MQLLEGVVRHYDWGSATAIPSLLGRYVDGRPWAELWLGANRSAPSLVGGGDGVPLDRVIDADPVASLGVDIVEAFGELPFLLKIIAADAPLSIQVHPSLGESVAGFERETAAGVPIDAPNRSFRDRNHKPELICALTRFDALCGLRDPEATLRLLRTIEVEALDPVRVMLAESDGRLKRLLEWILTLRVERAADLVEEVVDGCRRSTIGEWSTERRLVVELGDRYPGDVGIIVALLLNSVSLQPGEALFLGPGVLHSYIGGTGVEIMANSDNVVRGGLTHKHVDVSSFLEVVDATPCDPQVQIPASDSAITRYHTPVPEFCLSRVRVDGNVALGAGPAIALCVEGGVEINDLALDRGSAVWVPVSDGALSATGKGTLFWAGVGQSG